MSTTQAILEKMAEQFMQPSITRKMAWVELDGTHGSTFLPLADVGAFVPSETDDDDEAEIEYYSEYYEGTIQSINYVDGFGARLSAPGYMDATDWTVFPTEAEAEDYLVDTYGDDIELDEDEV